MKKVCLVHVNTGHTLLYIDGVFIESAHPSVNSKKVEFLKSIAENICSKFNIDLKNYTHTVSSSSSNWELLSLELPFLSLDK